MIDGFNVAFQCALECSRVQHINRVFHRFVPLLGELSVSLAMLVDRLAANAGMTSCERNGIGHRECCQKTGPPHKGKTRARAIVTVTFVNPALEECRDFPEMVDCFLLVFLSEFKSDMLSLANTARTGTDSLFEEQRIKAKFWSGSGLNLCARIGFGFAASCGGA